MESEDLRKHCMALLIRISVITGWSLPTGNILNVVIDQFRKKLLEDYPTFNTEEIEYAFRHSGTSVEDWGKEVNLNLIDKVLWPYEIKRREAGRMLERLQQPKTKPWSDEDIKNLYRSQIEEYFQALKKGYYPIRHKYYEETLREDGMIPENENMDEFLVRKLATANNLYLKEK
jgi:hypothetical protein